MDGHEGGDCDDDRDTETDDEDEARDSDDYGDSGDGNDNEDGDDGADDDADDADGDDEAGVRNGPPASSPNCDCHILGMPNRTCGSTAREASCTLCKIRSAGTRWA